MNIKSMQTSLKSRIFGTTQRLPILFAMFLILVCGGCWEEIRYKPERSPAVQQQGSGTSNSDSAESQE